MNKKLICPFLIAISSSIPFTHFTQARNDMYRNIFPEGMTTFVQNQVPILPQRQPRQRIRHKFSPEEDEQLKDLVKQYGTKSWALISSLMKTRSQRQCRERWKHYLSVPDKKAVWTDEEDEIIMNTFQELGKKWTKIAAKVQGKSDLAVKNRVNILLKRKPDHLNSSQEAAAASTTPSVASSVVSENSNTPLPFQTPDPDSATSPALNHVTNSDEKELMNFLDSVFQDFEITFNSF